MISEREAQAVLYGTAAQALKNAYRVVRERGDGGREEIDAKAESGINKGKKVLVADLEAEKAVIETLRQGRIPIRLISEEHGEFDLTDNPIYLGILDGLDGSNKFKREGLTARVGTMLGIFKGLNPVYDDYLYSGIIEHPEGRLFFAEKGQGSFIFTPPKAPGEWGRTVQIQTARTEVLDEKTRIYIDEGIEFSRKFFSPRIKPFSYQYLHSSCNYYMDVASGEADLALECTRKRNLEIAVSYGLIKEAGGIMVSTDGKSLAERKYLEFGQGKNEFIPVITSCTKELARALIKHLEKS